nr:contactin-1 [Parasteatoda tepidariorum]
MIQFFRIVIYRDLFSGVPSIRKFLFQDNVVEGDSVTVTCFAVTKTKPITFNWLKNDNTISERKQNVRYETGNEISNLILDPVKLEDSGNYTCSATNSDGTDNYTAFLNVKASPKWIEQPNDISTIVGLSVEARCLATGSPHPTITWRKYTDKSQHSKEIVNSTSLRIPSVSHEAGGVYECTAQNGILPNLKANFTLSVRGMKIIEITHIMIKLDFNIYLNINTKYETIIQYRKFTVI